MPGVYSTSTHLLKIEPEVGVNGAVALTLSKDEIDDDEYKHAFESWRNLVKSCNDFGKEIENKRAQLKEDLKEFEAKKRRLTRFYGVVSEDLKSYEVDFQVSRINQLLILYTNVSVAFQILAIFNLRSCRRRHLPISERPSSL